MLPTADEIVESAKTSGSMRVLEEQLYLGFKEAGYLAETQKEVEQTVLRYIERNSGCLEHVPPEDLERVVDEIFRKAVEPEISRGSAGIIIDDYLESSQRRIVQSVDAWTVNLSEDGTEHGQN